VAGRLGHADASTTMRIYAHALAEKDREAAELLGGVLAKPQLNGST
jgi:integrase